MAPRPPAPFVRASLGNEAPRRSRAPYSSHETGGTAGAGHRPKSEFRWLQGPPLPLCEHPWATRRPGAVAPCTAHLRPEVRPEPEIGQHRSLGGSKTPRSLCASILGNEAPRAQSRPLLLFETGGPAGAGNRPKSESRWLQDPALPLFEHPWATNEAPRAQSRPLQLT